MRLILEGVMEFSKPLEPVKLDFPKLVAKEINSELFKKGVPPEQEGSRIVHWSIEGSKLLLTIEGTTYLRPHDAFLRLRNFLSEKFGKDYGIGVRNIFVKYYEIRYTPKKLPKEKIQVKVPWFKDAEVKGNELMIKLQNLDSTALEDRYVERILRRVEEKIELQEYGGKAEHWELIWKSKEKKPVWDKDPSEEMEKLGWIKRFDTGVWLYTPIPTKIFRTMQQIAIKEVIKPLKFEEVILPKVTPLEVWLRTGHVPGSSNSFFYVSKPLTYDQKFWEDFADYVKVTNKIPYEQLKEKLEPPRLGVCFAQCPPFYWYFEKKSLREEDLPIKVWDASGTSMRWEAGGLHGIERVCEFHRIELIWLGTKEQALEIREKLVERYKYVFEKILDIEWRMAWVTPWYMAQAGQVGETEKEKGTIDFEAWLPFRGSRESSEWLEFQNITVAGTKFSDAWDFKTSSGKEVWSGCSGIGLERWVVAFLAQKGLDSKKWPREFAKRFGKTPKEFHLI
ncbi:MAG: aminoacyl--tRNA ligase-related protein [Candidatus Aenigmatarchaeota archaeon]